MPHDTRQDTTEAVDVLMAGLKHPHRDGIQALRKIVLAADPGIREGVKWKAPSFRTHEYFATTHLRSKVRFGLILHRGAKVRAVPEGRIDVADPSGVLTWLSEDRAMIEFRDGEELQDRAITLQRLLRGWIAHV